MTTKQFRSWLLATLDQIPVENRAPIRRFAEIVAEAKAHAYAVGLYDLALTLPDTEEVKTALTAANQLRRCLHL